MEIFSEYLKRDNFLLAVDARIKLLFALGLLAMVLSYKGFFFPLLTVILSLGLCLWLRVPLRIVFMRFSEPLFIASIIVVLKVFFSGKELLFYLPIPYSKFSLFTLVAHRDGLMEGMQIASRILGAVSIVVVMGFLIPFTEFISALSWMRIPKGFVEILLFTYRYIFVLMEDAMVIYNAQKNRLGYSSIRRGLSSFSDLTASLILRAFEKSEQITSSMIQRGYDGGIPAIRHRPFKATEVLVSLLILTVLGVIWRV